MTNTTANVGDWVKLSRPFRGCRIGRVSRVYGDKFHLTLDSTDDLQCVRSNFRLLPTAEQHPPHDYFPMRKTLPYGRYVCADGSYVLFNRDYEPLWRIHPDGSCVESHPNEWILHDDDRQEWFYKEGHEPWIDEAAYAICVQQLPPSTNSVTEG